MEYRVWIPTDDHQFKEEKVGSVGELPKVCSQLVPIMSVLGAHWQTRHSMVREQTCKCCHQMDPSL